MPCCDRDRVFLFLLFMTGLDGLVTYLLIDKQHSWTGGDGLLRRDACMRASGQGRRDGGSFFYSTLPSVYLFESHFYAELAVLVCLRGCLRAGALIRIGTEDSHSPMVKCRSRGRLRSHS